VSRARAGFSGQRGGHAGLPLSAKLLTAYEVSVFDVSGRLNRVLDRGNARAGRFAVDWDLNSDEGQPARGGIYFLRFTLGGATQTRRLLVLR